MLGTLRLPLILLFAGSPSSAAGTNIGISAAAAASGGLRHAREGRVSWQVVRWMTPPSVAGAVVGGLYGHDVPKTALLAGTAAVLFWNGVDLLVRPLRATRSAPATVRSRRSTSRNACETGACRSDDAPAFSEGKAARWFEGKIFATDWTSWHFPNWAKLLAPYRSKMIAAQIEQLHRQYLNKKLLERAKLPRLSLFYM